MIIILLIIITLFILFITGPLLDQVEELETTNDSIEVEIRRLLWKTKCGASDDVLLQDLHRIASMPLPKVKIN